MEVLKQWKGVSGFFPGLFYSCIHSKLDTVLSLCLLGLLCLGTRTRCSANVFSNLYLFNKVPLTTELLLTLLEPDFSDHMPFYLLESVV